MARVDAVGFETTVLAYETDSTTIGSGGAVAIAAVPAARGSSAQALRVTRTGAALLQATYASFTKAIGGPGVTVKASIYLETLAAGGERVLEVAYTALSGEKAYILVFPSGSSVGIRAALENTVNGVLYSPDRYVPLGMNKWIDLTIRVRQGFSGANDDMQFWLADGQTATVTVDRLSGNSTEVRAGAAAPVTDDFDCYFDDIIMCNGSDWIPPPTQLEYLTPNAAGTFSAMTVVGGGSAQTNLADTSDATGVRGSGAAPTATTVNTTPSTIATDQTPANIAAVYGSLRHGNATDLGGRGSYLSLDTTSAAVSSALIPSSALIVTARSVLIQLLNAVGTAWTKAVLDSLQIGAQKGSGGLATDQFSVWKAWAYAEVYYGPTPTDSAVETRAIEETVKFGTTDAATLAESTMTKARFDQADAAAFAEALLTLARFSSTDSAALTESVVESVKFGTTDAATLAESTLMLIRLDMADAAAFLDAIAILARFSLTDSAAFTDTVEVRVGLPLTDAAAETTSLAVLIKVPVADAAALVAAVSSLLIRYDEARAATLTDTIETKAKLDTTDAAAFTDSLATAIRITLVDDGALTEDVIFGVSEIPLADVATLLDEVSDLGIYLLQGTDVKPSPKLIIVDDDVALHLGGPLYTVI